MKHQESGVAKFNRVWVPKVTALGASIVILGALFKIEHYEGASAMLIIGLTTEAFIFFLGVFQPAPPPDKHYHWEKVYPQLTEKDLAPSPVETKKDLSKKELAALASIDKMIAESNISVESLKRFGKGIDKMNTSVEQIKDISDISNASNEYTKNLKKAAGSVDTLIQSFSVASSSMNLIGEAGKGAQEYHSQIQLTTRNLGALNAVYEMELKDANSHLKAMNKFYGNLVGAMQSMSDASKESANFREHMTKLTDNLNSLNKVYGNMITAMKGV